MKKLLFFLLINGYPLVASTQLSEAILKSDYKKVCVILNKISITEEEKIAYLDLADNVIESRRKNTEFDWIKQFVSKKILLGILLGISYLHDNKAIAQQELLKNFSTLLHSEIAPDKNLNIVKTTNGLIGFSALAFLIYGIYDKSCFIDSLYDNLEAAQMIKFTLLNS